MALPSSEAIAASLNKGAAPQQKTAAVPSTAHILSAIPGMAPADLSQKPLMNQTFGDKSIADYPTNTKPIFSNTMQLHDNFGVPVSPELQNKIVNAHAVLHMQSTPTAFANTPQRRLDAPTFGTNKYSDDTDQAALLMEGLDRISGAIPYALSGGNPFNGKPLVKGGGDYPRGISEQASNLAEEAFGTSGKILEPGKGFKGKISPTGVKGAGLVIGALGDPLNLIGGGEAANITKLIRGAEDAEHVGTILREAGLAHDIADQYKTILFDSRTDAKAMHEALAAAEQLHNSTRMSSLIEEKAKIAAEKLRAHAAPPPVPESVKTLALERAKQLGQEVPEEVHAETPKPKTAEEAATRYWDEAIAPKIEKGEPVVLAGDDMKAHFGKDYDTARSDLYAKANYKNVQRAIKEVPGDFALLGGGPGSGKTELLTKSLLAKGFKGVLYDTTLSNFAGSKRIIEEARAAGKKIHINGIITDLERALDFTKSRALEEGREVSDEAFKRGHQGFPETLKRLLEEGVVSPDEVQLYDMRFVKGKDEARKMVKMGISAQNPLDLLNKAQYSDEHISQLFKDYATRTEQKGTELRRTQGANEGTGRSGDLHRPPSENRADLGNGSGRVERMDAGAEARLGEGAGSQGVRSAERIAQQEEAANAASKEAMPKTEPLPKEEVPTPSGAIEQVVAGKEGKSWADTIRAFFSRAPQKAKVHLFDYIRTPEYVLQKVGLGHIAEKLHDAQDSARVTLKKEITRIEGWMKQVNNDPNASRLIFQYLDGQEKDVVRDMTFEEHEVAKEIRGYLKDWADRLHLPEDNQISHYITHIFERQVGERFESPFADPELAALMKDKVAGSVYDPFLQKRLGGKEYVEDVWRALDAYVKRGVRKEAMDPVLEQMVQDAKNLDDLTYNYVTKLSHRINMRPTGLEHLMDSFITQTRVGHIFTDRPTAFLSKKIRQIFYRGTLGLNFSAAIRNLTQGVNTYAKLGEKYTVVGYTKLIERMAKNDLSELVDEGILDDNFIQDRIVGVNKKMMQKVDAALFAPFQFAEKINRGAAYFGAKAKMLSKGATEAEAIKYAKQIVRETQFSFGAVDTPVVLNDDFVKTLMQLQTYNIKQMEFLGRMASSKDFAGMVRWTGGSIAMLYSLGYVIGMTKDQLLPTIGFGGAPVTSLLNAGKETLSSDAQTHAQGIADLERSGSTLFPAGAQARKTYLGAQALMQGRSATPTGKTRFAVDRSDAPQALLFGPSALPQAQEYYKSIGATPPNDDLQKRIKAQNTARNQQKQDAEDQYQHLKDLRASQGSEAALAEWKRIAKEDPELSKAIKQVGDAEAQGLTKDDRRVMQLGVTNGARAQYVYDQLQKLDTKEAKQELWKEYAKKKIITSEVSTQVEKLFAGGQ